MAPPPLVSELTGKVTFVVVYPMLDEMVTLSMSFVLI